MAYKKEKTLVLQMRKSGMSYSQIRERVSVSKSTLSKWLQDFPLSENRMKELRDNNPKRIERFRATMKIKRDKRIDTQRERVGRDIGKLTQRELFIAGFFLFWGEGSKGRSSMVAFANTDPVMVKCFLDWVVAIGGERKQVRFVLHLYKDMDVKKELAVWSKALDFPLSAFTKPYIKQSNLSEVTYRNGFGHGTCNVRYMSQDLNDYVRMGLFHIRELYNE